MHSEEKVLIARLNKVWDDCLQEAFKAISDKLIERKPEHEQISALWQRFNTSEQFSTMIMLKANRVASELATVLLDEHHTWDSDNARDLVAYTLFLIAYSQFVKTDSAPPTMPRQPAPTVEDLLTLHGDHGPLLGSTPKEPSNIQY